MPQDVRYPGVYVQDLPSFRHTVSAVATTIAAFVGRTLSGPVENPTTIFSFGDFQRSFGGLGIDYPLGYAVQQFFLNGGFQAQICRLFDRGTDTDGYARLSLAAPPTPLGLIAASPGSWGNLLRASVDTAGITAETAARFGTYGLGERDLFNLTLSLMDGQDRIVASERYQDVAVTDAAGSPPFPNRIDRVLEERSNLARVERLSSTAPVARSAAAEETGDDGMALSPATMIGNREAKTGLYALENSPLFNMLCIPPDARIRPGSDAPGQDLDPAVRQAAAGYCAERRAMFIVDPPGDWLARAKVGQTGAIDPALLGIGGTGSNGSPVARNAAVYFPRILAADALDGGKTAAFAPCGAVAGIIAVADTVRGVWKAPAGQTAAIAGITGLETGLTDAQNGLLNAVGINCLRDFPAVGPVIWGARTLQGADALADDYKFLPVRRLVLFIEESVRQSTQWAALEPSDEQLWSALRLQISAFLTGLSDQGAFYSFAVACDATTTTQADIDRGKVNIIVRIAPEKPAEFIVVDIQQNAAAAAA